MVVATAAPCTPSSGKKPMPKMKSGSSTMLMPLARASVRKAMPGLPAPLNTAFSAKSRVTTRLLANMRRA